MNDFLDYNNISAELVIGRIRVDGYLNAKDLFLGYIATKIEEDFDYLKSKIEINIRPDILHRSVILSGDQMVLYDVMNGLSQYDIRPDASGEILVYDMYKLLKIEFDENNDLLR